jgi:hypothetical protein
MAVNVSQQELLRHQVEIQIDEMKWCMIRTDNDTLRCAYWVRHNTKAELVSLWVCMLTGRHIMVIPWPSLA